MFFQVSVFCSARALARLSWSSSGLRVSMRRPIFEVVHCFWKGQSRQVRTLKVTTMASVPCCWTEFQWELILPAGQRTWRVFQLMVKAFLSKPSAALACAEWSRGTGVTMRIPSCVALVIRSADG